MTMVVEYAQCTHLVCALPDTAGRDSHNGRNAVQLRAVRYMSD